MSQLTNDKEIKFDCLASSSSGNAFVMRFPSLADGLKERLLLVECGLPFRDLENKLFRVGVLVKQIQACLITHNHTDHSESMVDLLIRGIGVYANSSTIGQHGSDLNAHIITNSEYFEPIKDILVYPFNTAHNVPSLGFVIYDRFTRKTIMFINDTRTFIPPFNKELLVDYLFIECNHVRQQLEMVIKAISASDNQNEKSKLVKYERQRDVHLSLYGTKKMIREHIGVHANTSVFLMHLSSELGNEYVMKKEIEKTFNVKTYVCSKSGGIK
ncbi:MAG: hypothetical protein EOM77_06220 [Bacteroidia bacterium]|nr:hypothetical protein [Bacteroidia bacterium]